MGGDGGRMKIVKGTEGQPDLTGSLEHNRAKDTGISYKLRLNMHG